MSDKFAIMLRNSKKCNILVSRSYSLRKVSLKISQNSQENGCVEILFLIKLQAFAFSTDNDMNIEKLLLIRLLDFFLFHDFDFPVQNDTV